MLPQALLSALSMPYSPSMETDQLPTAGKELKTLKREYPGLAEFVKGASVVDFGCGRGYQAIALAREFGCRVIGLDTNRETLAKARMQPGAELVEFVDHIQPGELFDVVISQNAMEHFSDPAHILQVMKSLIKPNGQILITFGPPWFAPFGHHMHFFCKIPWLQFWFRESAVMAVRSRYIKDGAKRYEDVTSGLNKMSLRKFERLVRESGLRIAMRRYTAVKQLNVLTRIPILRELFTNHVTVVLAQS